MADHSPLIEQLERWAEALEQSANENKSRELLAVDARAVIKGMREVAADPSQPRRGPPAALPGVRFRSRGYDIAPGEVDDGPPSYCTTCDREVAADAS